MKVCEIACILGHISSKTTIDIRLHSTDEMKKNAANKINARFSKCKVTDENVKPMRNRSRRNPNSSRQRAKYRLPQ